VRNPPPTPPVLWAFLAILIGAVGAGLVGPAHALAAGSLVFILAWVSLLARGLRLPRSVPPLWALVLLGALRVGMDAGSLPPGAGMPAPPEAVRAEVRLGRVLQRHRLATVAEVSLRAVADPSGAVVLPEDGGARLRFKGFLDLPEGRVLAVRARWIPPPRPSEAISPAWPSPAPRPTLALVAPADAVVLSGPDLPTGSWIDRIRAVLATRLRLHLPPSAADFALAVLLGEGNGIDAGTRADLAVLGTAHVLSVSGLHVAAAAFLVGLVVVRLLGPLLLRAWPATNLVTWHMGASILAAWGVSLLAGSPAPAVRSAGMFAVAAVGALGGRPQRVEGAVAVTGFASLLAWPSDAFSISFLLSYGAILGLAVLGPPLADRMVPARWRGRPADELSRPARLGRALIVATATSLAATLATTPVTLMAFGQTGPAGPLANLFAIPATTLVVMPAALGLLVVAAVAPGALPWASPPVGWILDAFLWTQRVQARVLPALVAPGTVVLAATMALTLAAIAGLLRRGWVPVLGAALLGVAVVLSFPRATTPPPAGTLAVTLLDVGKGDAVLVRCPTGRVFLVDAAEARMADGPSGLVAKLRAIGVDALDGLVLTHADEDHVGGTPLLLRSLTIAEVVTSCPAAPAEPLRGILDDARSRGVPVRCVVADVDALPGCADSTPILAPPALVPARGNAASLVFRVSWRGRSILLTGDLESAGEEALVDTGVDLRADVLKLGHHGSPGASSPAFLDAVHPATAVISGFRTRRLRELSPETVRRVGAIGAALFATPDAGDVTVRIDEDGILTVGGTRTPGPRFPARAPGSR
jgi:competence protein ComEC